MQQALSALKSRSKGFTLIELLVVIGILAVLLAIVLVAINPARQFAQANNTQRSNDVNALLNAIHQYAADNNGLMPSGITNDPLVIGSNVGQADLCTTLVTDYLAALPVDPQVGDPIIEDECDDYDTGYVVVSSATNNRITVSAPGAELGASISATR